MSEIGCKTKARDANRIQKGTDDHRRHTIF